MGFVTRAHRHLWGKNNEDPLVFLFKNGLSNEFCKNIYLGWNKFGQDRPLESWGLSAPDQDRFHLPAGIVIPHIENQCLTGVLIVSMAGSLSFWLPGSHPLPMELGHVNAHSPETTDAMAGLKLFQDHPEGPGVRIWTTP